MRDPRRDDLLQEIAELEQRAHEIGMTVTAHALNNVENAAGWEMAGDIERAGLAAKGERAKGGSND